MLALWGMRLVAWVCCVRQVQRCVACLAWRILDVSPMCSSTGRYWWLVGRFEPARLYACGTSPCTVQGSRRRPRVRQRLHPSRLQRLRLRARHVCRDAHRRRLCRRLWHCVQLSRRAAQTKSVSATAPRPRLASAALSAYVPATCRGSKCNVGACATNSDTRYESNRAIQKRFKSSGQPRRSVSQKSEFLIIACLLAGKVANTCFVWVRINNIDPVICDNNWQS